MQHYAFLVDDERFDEILARVQARGSPYTADPQRSKPQEINTNHGGRGFYYFDPAGHGLEVLTRPYGENEVPATDVRLIVLATVRHLEPATGYAIRKRLVEQGVEAWGGVSVASIYSVLRTLTKHGQLEELDDPTGVRRNTKAYRTTRPAGKSAWPSGGARWRRSIPRIRSRSTSPSRSRRDAAGVYVDALGQRLATWNATSASICLSWSRRCATPRGCGETSPRPKRAGSGRRSRQRLKQPVRRPQRDADRVLPNTRGAAVPGRVSISPG